VRRLALGVLAVALAFTAVTLLALEGGEVVVLRTFDAERRPRETRTWVADADGAAWIEAAIPGRRFLGDLAAEPRVELRRGGTWRACRAEVHAGPEGHARIRTLLRARYGWADRWIGMLADTRRSAAVRVDCGS
jgi:hypothetical protein